MLFRSKAKKKKISQAPHCYYDPFPKDISLVAGLEHHGSLGCTQRPSFSSLLCLFQEEAAAKLPDLDRQAQGAGFPAVLAGPASVGILYK